MYMIHTCPKREWYVSKLLLPSMYEQGITDDEILIFEDLIGEGVLESCMHSFASIKTKRGHTWHLQDDVVLCRDFAQRTRALDKIEDCIICGFASEYDKHDKDKQEYVTPKDMWFSFPCIRIPNALARECADWYDTIKDTPEYEYIRSIKKHDDLMFKEHFLKDREDVKVKNLIPNLVDHVDYLIGGSLVNPNRQSKVVRSLYWEDADIISDLKAKLNCIDKL